MIGDIKENILTYIQIYQQDPLKLITVLIDLAIVIFLAYNLLKIVKDSRAWQLVKGIALLIIATWISRIIKFKYIKLHIISSNELGSNIINYNFSTGNKKSFRAIRY